MSEDMIGDFGQSRFPEDKRYSIETAIGYLANLCGPHTNNGRTALYWHLVATVSDHMKPAAPK